MVAYISLFFLLLTSFVSLIDGMYFHIIKLNLHYHEETKKEHLLHTLRALLFSLILGLIFYGGARGVWLWLGLLIVGIDFVLEILDIKEEGQSRKIFNGLSNNEYLLHALAISFRSITYGLWFSLYSKDHFILSETGFILNQEFLVNIFLLQLLISSILVTVVHVYLIFKPRPIDLALCRKYCSCC